MVADMISASFAEITVVIVNKAGKNHFVSPYDPRLNPLCLSQFWLYLDHRVFHPTPNALEVVNLKESLEEESLEGLSVIEVDSHFDGLRFGLNASDEKRLRGFGIDVLLLFCSGLPTEQISSLARYGIWFFLDQVSLINGNPPLGFWEVLEQRPVIVQCLQAQLAGSPRPLILHRYCGPTDLRSISRARNSLLWKSSAFIVRKLDALHRLGSLEAIAGHAPCDEADRPPCVPSNLTVLKRVVSHISRFVRDRINEYRYVEQWMMGYTFTSTRGCLAGHNYTDYKWLVPPKDRSWADPFPVRYGDHYFVFFEEYFHTEAKGYLCVAAIDQNGFKEEPRVILKQTYHLSYPFVFSWQGEWYLMPESQEAHRIDIFKFDAFPYHLGSYTTIMANVDAADTTLLEVDGQWWMFAAIACHGTWNVDELFLFWADNPFGPWAPHPRNPIKSDVRSARPAGKIFVRQGRYYRPTQDCSQGYGYAVRLQEIKVLTKTDYVEEEVQAFLPDWAPHVVGTHTLNTASNLTTIDAKQWCPR